MFFSGLDVKRLSSVCGPASNSFAGDIDELGQIRVRTIRAPFAVDWVSSLRGALKRRTQAKNVLLTCDTVPTVLHQAPTLKMRDYIYLSC